MADFKEATNALALRHGLKRVPGLKLNTAAIRQATLPSARDQALAAAGLDAAGLDAGELLDAPDSATDEDALAPAAFSGMATPFDPADLL